MYYFNYTYYYLHMFNYTRLTALCPGLPRWAGTRKVKPIWILLKQMTVSGSGIRWAVCKSAPRSRQTTTPAHHHSVFTARCYASAVLAIALCPSVTSRCSTKTAKHRMTQTTPHDTSGTLVFWCQRSPRNSTGVTPYGGAKCRWGGSKSATFDK